MRRKMNDMLTRTAGDLDDESFRRKNAAQHLENWTAVAERGRREQAGIVHTCIIRIVAASIWNARARCDKASEPSAGMPCFSSALISPKVRSCPSGVKHGS